MKQAVLLSTIFLISLGFGQNSGVRIEYTNQPGVALNGQTIEVQGANTTLYAYLSVVNITENDLDLLWERSFCEGIPNLTGEQFCDDWSCADLPYTNSSWISPSARNIASNASSVFEPKVVFADEPCDSVLVCYYVLNANQERLDSIKIHFKYLNPDICSESANVLSQESSKLLLYPNPSNGQINIKDASAGSTLEITDMVGKVIMKTKLTGANQSIDLSSNPDGVYFYTIKPADGGKAITKKLALRR